MTRKYTLAAFLITLARLGQLSQLVVVVVAFFDVHSKHGDILDGVVSSGFHDDEGQQQATTRNNFGGEKNIEGDFSNRIVGGVTAAGDEFPWFAGICITNQCQTFHCGGTLISPFFVLTAAHCDLNTPFVAVVNTTRQGLHYDNSDDGGRVVVSVAEKVRHPDFEARPSFRNDFMLLRLQNPVLHVRPLPLNGDYARPSYMEEVTVIGTGTTDPLRHAYPDMLQKVNVNAVDGDSCQKAYGGLVLDEEMLCAGIPGGGKDACIGDSGSAVVDINKRRLLGVVSWGNGCALPDNPGVYARVSSAKEWILNQMDACEECQQEDIIGSSPRKLTRTPTASPADTSLFMSVVTKRPQAESQSLSLSPTTETVPSSQLVSELNSSKPTNFPFQFSTLNLSLLSLGTSSSTFETLPSNTPSNSPSSSQMPTPASLTTSIPSMIPSEFPSSNPSDEPTWMPTRSPTGRPTSPPTTAQPTFGVDEFFLVDTSVMPQARIRPIEDGETIVLDDLPETVDIEAVTHDTEAGSVLFLWDRGNDHLENSAPYDLVGSVATKDEILRTGRHAVTAVPYSEAFKRGRTGRSKTVRFHVVRGFIDSSSNVEPGGTVTSNDETIPSRVPTLSMESMPATLPSMPFPSTDANDDIKIIHDSQTIATTEEKKPQSFPTWSATLSPATKTSSFARPSALSANESSSLLKTSFPSPAPALDLTLNPTIAPTLPPTPNPTFAPTTMSPSPLPTGLPTMTPTESPTTNRPSSSSPTRSPTRRPTLPPTRTPTKSPTRWPTKFPTKEPTKSPTRQPTIQPTRAPDVTRRPTKFPTKQPTKIPTRQPTIQPTRAPDVSGASEPKCQVKEFKIDFDADAKGLPIQRGTYITNEYEPWGIMVRAERTDTEDGKSGGHLPTIDGHKRARIFDTSTPGPDLHLESEVLGNVLIIQKKKKATPDSNKRGGGIVFDFDRPVTVKYVDFLGLGHDPESSLNSVRVNGSTESGFFPKFVLRNEDKPGESIVTRHTLNLRDVKRIKFEFDGQLALSELLVETDTCLTYTNCKRRSFIDFNYDAIGNPTERGQYVFDEWKEYAGLKLSAVSFGDWCYTPDSRPRIFDTANPTTWVCDDKDDCYDDGDEDLASETLGNVLIIQERDKAVPDDCWQGGVFTVSFDEPVEVHSVTMFDVGLETLVEFRVAGPTTHLEFTRHGAGDNTVVTYNVGQIVTSLTLSIATGTSAFVGLEVTLPFGYCF